MLVSESEQNPTGNITIKIEDIELTKAETNKSDQNKIYSKGEYKNYYKT